MLTGEGFVAFLQTYFTHLGMQCWQAFNAQASLQIVTCLSDVVHPYGQATQSQQQYRIVRALGQLLFGKQQLLTRVFTFQAAVQLNQFFTPDTVQAFAQRFFCFGFLSGFQQQFKVARA